MNHYNTMVRGYCTIQFQSDLKYFNIQLSEKQLEQFLVYYEMLVEWNQVMNLTTVTEYEDVMKKHFVDSISLAKAFDIEEPPLTNTSISSEKSIYFGSARLTEPLSVIDVGTGAGFPGLALKIAFPNLKVTLLDSLNKRIHFLDAVIEKLGLNGLSLNGIETIHGRAEDFAKPGKYRESFDLCVSRAVANLSSLSEYCLPFVKQGGLFVSYKSEKVSAEIDAAANAITVLGGKLERQVEFTLPDSDIYRNLVIIKKQKATPKKYPRKAGLPTKEPLS